MLENVISEVDLWLLPFLQKGNLFIRSELMNQRGLLMVPLRLGMLKYETCVIAVQHSCSNNCGLRGVDLTDVVRVQLKRLIVIIGCESSYHQTVNDIVPMDHFEAI